MYSSSEGFDFHSEENAKKWRGLFANALRQIQKGAHPTLVLQQDGLNYVESLLLRLLNMIVTSPNGAVGNTTSTYVAFHHISDLEERIKWLFPQPLNTWAIEKATVILARYKNHRKRTNSLFSSADKTPLKTPVDKFHQLLQKDVLGYKIDVLVSQYILAVLEFIATDILQLSGHYVRNMMHSEITCQDIRQAMCADRLLMDLFYGDGDSDLFGPPPSVTYHHIGQVFLFESDVTGECGATLRKPTSQSELKTRFIEVVKELIREEQQFIRDLNLITKVFRDPLSNALELCEYQRLSAIFGIIDEILEFSNDFVFSLEDAIEVCDDEQLPAIANCLEDLAEDQEFDVFERYANEVSSFHLREYLQNLLLTPHIHSRMLITLGPPMLSALRYVLPQLLLLPVYHCFSYFKTIQTSKELLMELPKRAAELISFEQAESLMLPVKTQLEKSLIKLQKNGEIFFLRTGGRASGRSTTKMAEIQRSIDGWESKDIGHSCNEFIMEGPLSKVSSFGHRSTRLTERQAFLFDGLIVFCKANTKRSVTAAVTGRDNSGFNCDWRLKERFLIRNIEIVDRAAHPEDTLERTSSNFYLPALNVNSITSNATSSTTSTVTSTTTATNCNSNCTTGGIAFSSGHSNTLTMMGNGEHSPQCTEPQPFASMSSVANSVSNISLASSFTGSSGFTSGDYGNSTTSGAATTSTTTYHNIKTCMFEIRPRNQNHIMLVTKTPEEKDRWISQLTLLNTRSMLDRILDSRLNEEAKKHPLVLPHPSEYRFATEDFDTNIILEEKTNPTSNVPLIKGATLLKLIERLTYHEYGDTPLIRTFLTTYRSFCTPHELLELLKERFEIPTPDMARCLQVMHFANEELASPTIIQPPGEMMMIDRANHSSQSNPTHDDGEDCGGGESSGGAIGATNTTSTNTTSTTSPIYHQRQIDTQSVYSASFTFDEDNASEDKMMQRERDYREMVKKFRKQYEQPVQVRVINVLRHWLENHFYDFEREPELLNKLEAFLRETLNTSIVERRQAANAATIKLIKHMLSLIKRKREQPTTDNKLMPSANAKMPAIEWHLTKNEEEFDLLTLHPVEIARQLTLIESELFRAVKPSELVGCKGQAGVWTKKDKQKTSPNLMRLIRHNSNFTYYLEKCIVETENFEERVALVHRIVEILIVLQELNNFNGILEIASALTSACVFRLEHTRETIEKNSKLKKAFEEAKELLDDHFKKYREKLRSIDPPCVPFFGNYLTNMLLLEEGNCEYLSPPNHLENMSLHDTSGILSEEAVNCKLINFSKKRKVAEITGEIQNYQNLQYCLMVEPSIRHFIENLNPLGDMEDKEFTDYLYNKSLEIEPRGSKAPTKMPRRWPDRHLKAPGLMSKAKLRFAQIASLPSIDPLINSLSGVSVVSGGNHHRESSQSGLQSSSSSHHHQQQQNTPNSASSHVGDLDTISFAQQISPQTPLTPPHSGNHATPSSSSAAVSSNDPIFAPVMIGGQSSSSACTAYSPNTSIHSTQRFFPSHPPPTPSSASSHSASHFVPDFSLNPPPLPPRTYRIRSGASVSAAVPPPQQSPRNRFNHSLSSSFNNNNNLDDSNASLPSPISCSPPPPPLPPRTHSAASINTISRSASMQSYRDMVPPPLPTLPHPQHHHSTSATSNSSGNHSPFVHQRVNSDITLGGGGGSTSSSVVRRNSTLEPVPPRRFSQGCNSTTTTGSSIAPLPPPIVPSSLSSVPSSPLHTPLTPPSSSTSTHPPPPPPLPPLPSPSSSSSTSSSALPSPGGLNPPPPPPPPASSSSSSPVPELPPKTYRLSNACR